MISVIIPTRNRADLLDLALDSMARQTLLTDNFEILVVDNGSIDNTASVTQKYSDILGCVRYFYEAEPGLHVGRHRGMLEANGETLVFADDDIEAFPSWLASIEEAFSEPTVAMVGGNNVPMFLKPPPLWLKNMWERSAISTGRALPSLSILELSGPMRDFDPYYIWGCNFSIRKEILLAAGGFHPDGMPNELICFRGDGETHVSQYVIESGLKCLFHPGASVYHKVTADRMTFEYFRQRGFNQGVSDSYSILRNGSIGVLAMPRSLLRRLIDRVWSTLKSAAILDFGLKRALYELKVGHREGYAYHQKKYLENAEVRKWVHKSRYF